ncbi:MAG: hypothetical protein KF774_11965 [Planctomyces sp.]|nr:hypothetical protein [Planctomyces sp.]
MSPNSPLEILALTTLLRESLLRADHEAAYLLNPNDPGLVETLKALSAETASKPPGPGRKPIVSHANHVLCGLELANRALEGEQGVYESADWNRAWTLESVSDSEWRALAGRLESQSMRLISQVGEPRAWSEIMLTGAFAVAAHAAYHLGSIRQMTLDVAAP